MSEPVYLETGNDEPKDPLIKITKLLLEAKNLSKSKNLFTISTLIDLALYQAKEEYRLQLKMGGED